MQMSLDCLKEAYPIWGPFVKNWGKLMGLYLKERNQKSAPKLYKAILDLKVRQ